MIKLIASDMDGTLINSSHEISSRNLNAIRRAQESGYRICYSYQIEITLWLNHSWTSIS